MTQQINALGLELIAEVTDDGLMAVILPGSGADIVGLLSERACDDILSAVYHEWAAQGLDALGEQAKRDDEYKRMGL